MDFTLQQSIRSIIMGSNDPSEIWASIKSLVSKVKSPNPPSGSSTIKAAIVELISVRGADPKFAVELPKIIKESRLSKPEQVELLSFAEKAPKLSFVFLPPMPGHPTFSPTHDPALLRDLPLMIKEKSAISFSPPVSKQSTRKRNFHSLELEPKS